MSHKLLHRSYVSPFHNQPTGEGMAEVMKAQVFQPSRLHCSMEDQLNQAGLRLPKTRLSGLLDSGFNSANKRRMADLLLRQPQYTLFRGPRS
jgi:hypothetical protein